MYIPYTPFFFRDISSVFPIPAITHCEHSHYSQYDLKLQNVFLFLDSSEENLSISFFLRLFFPLFSIFFLSSFLSFFDSFFCLFHSVFFLFSIRVYLFIFLLKHYFESHYKNLNACWAYLRFFFAVFHLLLRFYTVSFNFSSCFLLFSSFSQRFQCRRWGKLSSYSFRLNATP